MYLFEATFLNMKTGIEYGKHIEVDTCGLDNNDFTLRNVWESALSQIRIEELKSGTELVKIELISY